jgi:hypothetical protein
MIWLGGDSVYYYQDGVLNYTLTSSSLLTYPPYIFGCIGYTGYVDDYTYHADFTDTGLISVMPHDYHIIWNLFSPSSILLKDASDSTLYSDHFNIQWSLGPHADGWDITNPPNSRYRITIMDPSGAYCYNSYINISAENAAAGIISIPFNSSYLGSTPTQYGLYHVALYDGSGIKSTDYFSVLAGGAYLYFDKATYTANSNAIVTYTIQDGYYVPSTYTYKIKIINAYGTEMSSDALSTQSGSKTFSLSGYDGGVYYAELVATPIAGGDDAVLYYATTEVSSYVTISGYVSDAETTAAIPGATVFIAQGSTNETLLTGSIGNYTSSNNWLSGSQINMTTNLSGYATDYNLFTPLAADTIELNITLVADNRTYSGVAIDGVNKDTQYHSTIPEATVYERVNGSSAAPSVTTANAAAYYRFDNLVNGTVYDVWSSKAGYANSTVEQKLAVGA